MRHLPLVLILGSMLGCVDHQFGDPIDGGTDETSSAEFPAEISAIWSSRSCTNAGCHGQGAASANVALEPTDCESVAASNTVSIGDAASSSLWLEVEEETMPLSGEPLSQEEKDAVAAWINDGALCEE